MNADLVARIDDLQAEIDRLLDDMAEAQGPDCPGVPVSMIRQLLTKGDRCHCRIARRLASENCCSQTPAPEAA